MKSHQPPRICFFSGIPSVLTRFYEKLLRRVPENGYQLSIVSAESDKLIKLASSLRCQLLLVKITRQITPIRDLMAFFKVFLFFIKNRFDIIHTHTPKGGIIGLSAAFLARLPIRVYTMHGLPLETTCGMKRKLLWLFEKLSCSLSTHILAVSNSLREKVIEEKLCKPQKISVLEKGTACGIDVDHFTPSSQTQMDGLEIRHQLQIPQEAVVIGFLGRLTPEKGVDNLIQSFLELENEHEELYLLLIGDFDEVRETFEQSVLDTIKCHPRIIHIDFQENVIPYFAAMDIYVMPTRREGFGMTFLEAAAMNLPAIGSRVTGCVDAIVEGQTGLLVNLDDHEALKNSILKLVIDKQLRKRLGKAGRDRAEKHFTTERLVKAHFKFYDRLQLK